MNQQIKQRIEQINNGQVPEGYKKTEFGVFPCDWVTKKLDSVCQINPKTNCLPKQFIYLDLESVQDGKIIQKNIINIENAPSRAQRVLSKNDIIYQLVRPYQKNNLFFNVDDEQYPTVASTGYGLLRSKMQNYLFQILHADYFVNQVNVKCTGTNYPAINSDDLGKVLIAFPQSTAEQEKIAEILMKWDKAIELYNQQIDKLNMLKSACIKKMFPKRKSKIPELRFKGFTETWEQRKFAEVVQIERGGSPRPIDDYITDSPNGLNWVKIGDAPAQGHYITKTAEKIRPEGLSKTREVHPGDLILSNSMSFGKPYIMGIDGCIHDGWLLIRDTNNTFDLTFLCHLLGTPQMLDQYRSLAAGSTVNNLNKELVGNTVVTIPKIDEQRVLGQYLERLDNLITLHQRKVEIIIRQRKALQQYLLNGIVRVEV